MPIDLTEAALLLLMLAVVGAVTAYIIRQCYLVDETSKVSEREQASSADKTGSKSRETSNIQQT